MSIIDHTIHDHQGLKGEQNLAQGTTGTDAATLDNLPTFPLSIANGGTNSGTALTNGVLMVSLANAIVESAIVSTPNIANAVVQLDGSGNLPALNGSALTNLNASNISSGTISNSRIGKPTLVANTAGVGSPLVLTDNDTNKHYTNEGAVAEAYFTLPAAATVGVNYRFIVTDATGLRVVAVGTDTIQLDTATSAAAGYYESLTIGTCALIECVASGKWFVMSQIGTGAVV